MASPNKLLDELRRLPRVHHSGLEKAATGIRILKELNRLDVLSSPALVDLWDELRRYETLSENLDENNQLPFVMSKAVYAQQHLCRNPAIIVWHNLMQRVCRQYPKLLERMGGGPLGELETWVLWDEAAPMLAEWIATSPPAKTKPGEGNGGKKGRGRPKKKETKQRANFARPLVEQGLEWPEIHDKYAETLKGKADKESNADAMRLAYGREYPAK